MVLTMDSQSRLPRKTTWATQSQITWSGRRWGRRTAYDLCACGHNILAYLRAWLAWIVVAILNPIYHPGRQYQAVTAA